MAPDSIDNLTQSYLEAIEPELQQAVRRSNDLRNPRLYEMLAYHMGWVSQTNERESRGKRLRSLLALLSCSAAGGDWQRALPGATAVELVHNFSLIHDDIEDHSPLRRGRPTVWKKWGIPQAINCGDAMFALAHLEATRLAETVSPAIAMKAVELVQFTCLRLTEGQFLDLSYETRNDLTIEDYWRMVEGKTAALMATSSTLGAMAAFADEHICQLYQDFGHSLGLAFQAWDDWLGIWGNSGITGKSSQSDLVTGKITLPVLFGLSRNGEFAFRWKQGAITSREVPKLISHLEADGGKAFTEEQAKYYINEALAALEQAYPVAIYGEALQTLARSLAYRQA
jgi:geranylgeranyl diphosphate synthase type I